MKHSIVTALTLILALVLAACGARSVGAPPSDTPASALQAQDEPAGGAANGLLAITPADIAVTVRGRQIAAPFPFAELLAAGLTAAVDETETLKPHSSFMPNLFADEAEDYVISPDYENEDDQAVTLGEAQARCVRMACYADVPQNVGVSILGVSFGMHRAQVTDLLGRAKESDAEGLRYDVTVAGNSDLSGSFTVTFTADDLVDFVDLSVY